MATRRSDVSLEHDNPAKGRTQFRLVGLVAFVAGGAVMMLEILGTRIVGPVFGASLYVWSALIAVTLCSLAIGYYIGGLLGDRRPEIALLGCVLFISGMLLAVVPAVQQPVLLVTQAFGVRIGPLAAAAILFAPALVSLGTVAPIAVRLVTKNVSTAGAGVGTMSAVSTSGSLIATLATPYALIPALETNTVLFAAAGIVLLTSALVQARHRYLVLVSAALLPLSMSRLVSVAAPELPQGVTVLTRKQSAYSLVEVIDDETRKVRLLRADRSIIGGQFTVTHEPCFGFVHLLSATATLRGSMRDALVIGLGAGSVASALQAYGLRTDVVEIDSLVVQLAQSHFGFVPNGGLYIEDARTFIQHTQNKYDAIVQDTFTGGATPEHLLSIEFVSQLRSALTPDGVLALNFVGYATGPYAEAAESVARTLRAAFPFVRAFQDEEPFESEVANIVFFASASKVEFSHGLVDRWEVLEHVPSGQVISDGLNPLGRLQLRSAADHFAAMSTLLAPAVWAR